MTEAAFSATFSDWRLVRTRKCVQLVFEVPVELANEAYEILGGMPHPGKEVWCAVARLDMNTIRRNAGAAKGAADQQTSTGGDLTGDEREDNHVRGAQEHPAPGQSLVQRAGALCADKDFWSYLKQFHKQNVSNKDDAAVWLRQWCRVKSRAELATNEKAAASLELVEMSFRDWRDNGAMNVAPAF